MEYSRMRLRRGLTSGFLFSASFSFTIYVVATPKHIILMALILFVASSLLAVIPDTDIG
jgi:hypothetical protein